MLSEKVHGVKSKTVEIMKSRRELTYVHAVKLFSRREIVATLLKE